MGELAWVGTHCCQDSLHKANAKEEDSQALKYSQSQGSISVLLAAPFLPVCLVQKKLTYDQTEPQVPLHTAT